MMSDAEKKRVGMRQRAASTPDALSLTLRDYMEKDKMNNFEEESETFKNGPTKNTKSVVFSLNNEVGSLAKALTVFKTLLAQIVRHPFNQENDVNVCRIESRKAQHSTDTDNECEIFVDVECDDTKMAQVCSVLKKRLAYQQSVQESVDVTGEELETPEVFGMPWFPRRVGDLDKSAHRVLTYGSGIDLDVDHPGFKDPVYIKRRQYFADIALRYRHGRPVPRIKYTEEEIRTWGTVFGELTKLYPTHACREVMENIPLLVRHCGYRVDNVPQLQDISRYLKDRTGFTVRPVAGYLSSRDFLAGLAFRVFHCTQYIRHSSAPLYTPEPDCCHELLGHIPLLADAGFAHFSQELGLQSLGANDEEVQKLATCYFFTVEFGLCRQDGELRAYGAGLLSSFGELQHVLSDNAKKLPFNPVTTCNQECLITTYQDVYFYNESFEEAKEQMRVFARSIKRPFSVRYNAYTQTVDILHTPQQIASVVSELKGDLAIVTEALRKIRKQEGTDKPPVLVTNGDHTVEPPISERFC